MTITHQAKATEYVKIAARWGFKSEIQERIGMLVILWALFETNLELAVWGLRDEEVAGRQPSTDGRPLGEVIEASVLGRRSSVTTMRAICSAKLRRLRPISRTIDTQSCTAT